MNVKRITKIRNLKSTSAGRLAKSFENEGFITEIVATYLSTVGDEYCQFELNVYKENKRVKRWWA